MALYIWRCLRKHSIETLAVVCTVMPTRGGIFYETGENFLVCAVLEKAGIELLKVESPGLRLRTKHIEVSERGELVEV